MHVSYQGSATDTTSNLINLFVMVAGTFQGQKLAVPVKSELNGSIARNTPHPLTRFREREDSPHETKRENAKGKRQRAATIEEVRAALTAILDDIRSGDATVAEAETIKNETNKRIEGISALRESEKPEDKAALKLFFGK